MNETIKSITIIVFIFTMLWAGFSFYSAGRTANDIRERAERAEAELGRLTADYNQATARLAFFADGVQQSAKRVGRVSDEISSRVDRSLSTIGELREVNRAIQENYLNIACGCPGGRDAD